MLVFCFDVEALIGESYVEQIEGTIFETLHSAHSGSNWAVEKILATGHGDEFYDVTDVGSSPFDGPARRPVKKGLKFSMRTAHVICSITGKSMSPNI